MKLNREEGEGKREEGVIGMEVSRCRGLNPSPGGRGI